MNFNNHNTIRLAQVFSVSGDYIPARASLYLIPNITSSSDTFVVSNVTAIDATNISGLLQADYKYVFGDEVAAYTGAGYLYVPDFGVPVGEYPVAFYPIQAEASGSYRLWLRAKPNSTGNFSVSIMLDGQIVASINKNGLADEWQSIAGDTLGTTIYLNGSAQVLGLKLNTVGAALDKIVLSSGPTVLIGDGPSYAISPYITTHARIFSLDGEGKPDTAITGVWGFKTTLDAITKAGWYNFALTPLGGIVAYPDDSYAIVVAASGSSYYNYVVWDFATSSDEDHQPQGWEYIGSISSDNGYRLGSSAIKA